MSDMNERLKELSEKLEAGVKEIFSGEKYRIYLDTMSKFHRYSYRNSMLIFLQNPHATYVAGFGAWKSMERSVNKGEKGLQILAPASYKRVVTVTRDENDNPLPEPQEKEVTVTAFRPVYVFDVSQTQGKELPRLVTQLTGEVAEYDKLLHSLCATAPYPIKIEAMRTRVSGCYYPTKNYIAVKEGMSQEQTIKTAIHEIAHAKFGHTMETNRRLAEVQAESVAYIVCQHFGIDSSQYSFGYVAGWSRDKNISVLKDCLASIQTVAKEVIDGVEMELSREKTMEKEVVQEVAAMTPGDKDKKHRADKSKKLGVTDRLEAAKKQVAEHAAAAPPQKHTQSRSSGHSR